MLDFGFSEIVLTSFIALIVLGPEKLPKVARQVGNWMGRARVMARQLTEQLEREVTAEELLKATEGPKSRREALAAIESGSVHPDRAEDPLIAPATAPVPPPSAATSPLVGTMPAPPTSPGTPEAPPSWANDAEAGPSASGDAPEAPPASDSPRAADPSAPEVVSGLPASQTTAAAMHANDTPSPAANPAHHDTPTA
ncbi:MAG TPA: Sec-independent protein translocase protein TatB [Steroidobacteraceae bacterium]|jgi:sec-independent protein translocase protein TatB|nr:Sec-independent protein translocase protein TatB [Steroidobacteraceae bacterium]